MSKFQINQHSGLDYNTKGFKITFNNGNTVSVQFGSGTYSDDGQTTAEVGAWGPDGEWIKLGKYDDVKGHCTPEEVLEIMNQIANNTSI